MCLKQWGTLNDCVPYLGIEAQLHGLHRGVGVQQPGDQEVIPGGHQLLLLQNGILISQQDLRGQKHSRNAADSAMNTAALQLSRGITPVLQR